LPQAGRIYPLAPSSLPAGRAGLFGVKVTQRRGLVLSPYLLKVRSRTAHSRHQTLRAKLDWSYGHLSEKIERVSCAGVYFTLGHFKRKRRSPLPRRRNRAGGNHRGHGRLVDIILSDPGCDISRDFLSIGWIRRAPTRSKD